MRAEITQEGICSPREMISIFSAEPAENHRRAPAFSRSDRAAIAFRDDLFIVVERKGEGSPREPGVKEVDAVDADLAKRIQPEQATHAFAALQALKIGIDLAEGVVTRFVYADTVVPDHHLNFLGVG